MALWNGPLWIGLLYCYIHAQAKYTVCVCVCVCVGVCRCVGCYSCSRIESESFYRLLVMFSWIIICFVLEL